MADIMRCKIDDFIAFHIQMAGHFTLKHAYLDYDENTEVLGNSDADYKRFGFRPSIDYYRAKLRGENVNPWQFEKRNKIASS